MLKKKLPLIIAQMLTMAVAMLISEVISFLYPVDQSFWLPLSTFCVCLYISTPLTALRRTIHRIVGSLYGVILAGVICLVFPTNVWQTTFLVLFAGLTLWSRAFTALYYLFVTFMTASVIMLLAILMRHTTLTPDYLITERIIFTIIGSLLALIVSYCIMPSLEKLDMLRTYRHYLTRFYLEYRTINLAMHTSARSSTADNSPNFNFAVTQNVYQSSQLYREKLPLWRYGLLFNTFIFQSFTRFLHRIHKMRIMTCIILTSLHEQPAIPLQIQTIIQDNIKLTKAIITSLITLDRRKAQTQIQQLHTLNNYLEQCLRSSDKQKSLITILITLRDLEEDLLHLINGTLQIYLNAKHKPYAQEFYLTDK